MVKRIKIYRNNEYLLIPIEQYLEEYHSKVDPDWERIITSIVIKAFNLSNHDDYQAFLKSTSLHSFNYIKMKEFYMSIYKQWDFFDDDILKFIAFIYARDYFQKIGNPNLEDWLNAKDLNKPFKEHTGDESFSLMDVVNLKFGKNAVRNQLLRTLKIIT